MTRSLIEQLRDGGGDGHAGGCQGCFSSVMEDAATEVERLETALLASESLKAGYLDELERLRAANEVMLDALKEIVWHDPHSPALAHARAAIAAAVGDRDTRATSTERA